MSIASNIRKISDKLPSTVKLVAVSKFKPVEAVMEAYEAGQRLFGENRPQELKEKAEKMPSDIQWHFIGNLQSNKIKMVVPYASLIHSISSEKLLFEVESYCRRNDMHAEVLLEMFIATEETKQGFSKEELLSMLDRINSSEETRLERIRIRGLMGMASLTDDKEQIRAEFSKLLDAKKEILSRNYPYLDQFDQLSFGMSNDYEIAAEMGSTLVRVGTAIFGPRNY